MAKNDKVAKNRACWFGNDMVRVIDIYIPKRCDTCDATGKSEDKAPCKNCVGKSVITDKDGKEQPCPECKGTGKGDELAECSKCEGTGQIKVSLQAAEANGLKGPMICEFAKCTPDNVYSSTIDRLEIVKVGDVCRVVGSGDDWMLRVFAANATVTIIAVDHSCARLPVRVVGKRKDGRDKPRWAQFVAVKLGKGKQEGGK